MSTPITCLLPMKAHSSRVPGKNFKPIAGKPLFQWILDSLLQVELVSKVVINTDARPQLIAAGLIESERVVIRERKPELCGDEVSMNLVLSDDIAAYGPGDYLMTHTTNPLLGPDTIRDCIEQYFSEQDKFDSLFTVNRHQTRFYRQDASAINHDPNNLIPTQDLEPYFEENSCLYVFSADSFYKTQARIGLHPQLREIKKTEAVDIDEQSDWVLADILLRHNLDCKHRR